VRRPPVRDPVAVVLEQVLVAEARAADVDAAHVEPEPVVEPRRGAVAHVRLGHERLDARFAQRRVAAGVALEVVDAPDLEPDEVDRVVRDPLGVRLGEADAEVDRVGVALDPPSIDG